MRVTTALGEGSGSGVKYRSGTQKTRVSTRPTPPPPQKKNKKTTTTPKQQQQKLPQTPKVAFGEKFPLVPRSPHFIWQELSTFYQGKNRLCVCTYVYIYYVYVYITFDPPPPPPCIYFDFFFHQIYCQRSSRPYIISQELLVCVYVCICVCVRERVCVCVCVRERESSHPNEGPFLMRLQSTP